MKPKRAAAYVRVSSFDQNTEAQETALREYVQRRGWTLHIGVGKQAESKSNEATAGGQS